MGARPLARVIQEHIKKPLAEELLFGRLSEGGHVKIGVVDDQLSFDFESNKDGEIALECLPPDHPRLSGEKTPLLTAG